MFRAALGRHRDAGLDPLAAIAAYILDGSIGGLRFARLIGEFYTIWQDNTITTTKTVSCYVKVATR